MSQGRLRKSGEGPREALKARAHHRPSSDDPSRQALPAVSYSFAEDGPVDQEEPHVALPIRGESSSDGQVSIWQWRWALLRKVGIFAGPALTIPLADPVMTLIDTICISKYGTTLEVAALGPNVAVFNFSSFIFTSLAIATLSMVADRRAAGDNAGAGSIISHAIFIAWAAGALITGVILAIGDNVVRAIVSSPELVAPAYSYLVIRALAQPAAIAVMVANAAMMAQKDSLTPCRVVLLSAGINIALDVLFIRAFGMGIAGAAWATLISQLVAIGLLMVAHAKGSPTRVKAPLFCIPRLRDIKAFGGHMGPLTVLYVGKNLVYMWIQTSATMLATVPLAAHQLVWSVWAACTFSLGPIEQAAIAFIPSSSPKDRVEVVRLMVVCGAVAGMLLGALCCVPAIIPGAFTPDRLVVPVMGEISRYAFLALVLAGADVSATGCLLARKEFKYLASRMLVTLSIMSVYFYYVRSTLGVSVGTVWGGLCLFFSSRLFFTSGHLYGKVVPEMRGEAEASGGDSSFYWKLD